MSVDDKMTIDERRKYLNTQKRRYDRADQAERRTLLNEMASVTGLHRKSLIRLLGQPTLERHPAAANGAGRTGLG